MRRPGWFVPRTAGSDGLRAGRHDRLKGYGWNLGATAGRRRGGRKGRPLGQGRPNRLEVVLSLGAWVCGWWKRGRVTPWRARLGSARSLVEALPSRLEHAIRNVEATVEAGAGARQATVEVGAGARIYFQLS